ncbi:MAG: radical SAM protein [Lentisphaeria bacterium]|nr:radical SAM protein [Lentisphaeria bacterium]
MIRHVHFQLTLRCNLHCPFCGQERRRVPEAGPEVWLRTAEQLPRNCKITLWGGEPLLYEKFVFLAERLYDMGFALEIVTNGTLIGEENAAVLREKFSSVFISLDGGEKEHDSVRGGGTFAKAARGVGLLSPRRGKLVFLTTLHAGLTSGSTAWLRELEALGPDSVTLQPLIYLTREEIASAAKCGISGLERWERADDPAARRALEETLARISHEKHAVPVIPVLHFPSGVCGRPEHALHISPDGEACFCTDFTGYSIGNVFSAGADAVFASSRARKFREVFGKDDMPLCGHCPWRSQKVIARGDPAAKK